MTNKAKVTKKSQLISMLKGKNGVTVGQISARLGWQPHTTISALTRLRQTGYEIALKKSDKSGAGRYSLLDFAGTSK